MTAVLLLIAVGLPCAFGLGMWMADRECRRMWTEDHYCPICNRLTTEQESA